MRLMDDKIKAYAAFDSATDAAVRALYDLLPQVLPLHLTESQKAALKAVDDSLALLHLFAPRGVVEPASGVQTNLISASLPTAVPEQRATYLSSALADLKAFRAAERTDLGVDT
jgi:hypothetical protein